jgi:hypothetical protein
MDKYIVFNRSTKQIILEQDTNSIPMRTGEIKPEDFAYAIEKEIKDETVLLSLCYYRRKKEYPTIQDCIEALVESAAENRPEKLAALQAVREAVKAKYPKPEQKT